MAHKLIYLARRNPAIAEGDFGEAWKSHSLLASTLGSQFGRHFTRVRQCIKVHGVNVPPEYSNDHDGVALLTMKSWEDLKAARSHPSALSTLRDDELRVFAEHAANFTMATEEIFQDGAGEGNAALVHLARRKSGVDGDRFMSAWPREIASTLKLDQAFGGRGIVISRTLETPGPRYEFAAISESWFPTVDQAIDAAWNPARRALHRGLEEWVEAPVSLIVKINFEKIPAG